MAAPVEHDKVAIFEKAVNFINSKIGEDIDDLHKVKCLYDDCKASKLILEQQLSLASSAVPNKIKSAVADANRTTEELKKLSCVGQQVGSHIADYVADVRPLVKKLATLTNQIDELEQLSKYLKWVANIEDLSADIQSALIISSMERSVCQFVQLVRLLKKLRGSSCKHLFKFASDTAIFWHRILRDKFSSELSEVLAAWRWPFIVSRVDVPPAPATAEHRDRLASLFTSLLQLQLPDCVVSDDHDPTSFLSTLPQWRPLLLPISVMIEPLRKRFRYHFHGNRQTNSMEKPEWYFTQVISWIRDHSEFLDTHIQPLLRDGSVFTHIDAVGEFSRGLVALAAAKLSADVPDVAYDDHLLSHVVDETLAFERDLRAQRLPPAVLSLCLHVLTRPPTFQRWIAIERKFALEKVDLMLVSATAWQCQYQRVADVDSARVPECAESFITLMFTITERYRELSSPADRLVFLQLQLDLLDDFRVRLLQVRKEQSADPLGELFGAILNAAHYIVDVLEEWSELVFFIQLYNYEKSSSEQKLQETDKVNASSICAGTEAGGDAGSDVMESGSSGTEAGGDAGSDVMESGPSGTEAGGDAGSDVMEIGPSGREAGGDAGSDVMEGSLFDETRQLFEHLRREMLTTVVEYVVDDVKARSRPYRRGKWLGPVGAVGVGACLSPTACELLLVLKERLLQMELTLCPHLFSLLWPRVADRLNVFLYTELILENHFSPGGAAQLQFDMTRNLFPLFASYTLKPENYFKDVKEACLLLTLSAGSTLLLKDVLQQALQPAGGAAEYPAPRPLDTLHDVGVFRLTPDDCQLILSLKT